VDVYWIFGYVESEVVGRSVDVTAFDATTGEKHGEGSIVVVAAIAALSHGRAAEFAAPDDESVFEQVAVLEVLDESGDGLVGVLAVFRELFVQAAVLVPSFMEKLNEADVALNESAG
jgi:hypothetical protein